MIIELPDHYASNIGGAMVHRAAVVIKESQSVLVWIYQMAHAWNNGLRYGSPDDTFWVAVGNFDNSLRPLLKSRGLT